MAVQVALVARFWTKIFALFVFLSYALVYPFFVLYPLFELGIGTYDVTQYGVAYNVFANPTFWFVIILANLVSFGHRFVERSAIWLFRPQVCNPAHHKSLSPALSACPSRHTAEAPAFSRSMALALLCTCSMLPSHAALPCRTS